MTISLTVILIESTNEISYGLPIMITLMVMFFYFYSKAIMLFLSELSYLYHIILHVLGSQVVW